MQPNAPDSSSSSQQQPKHDNNHRPPPSPWMPAMPFPMVMQRPTLPPHFAPPPYMAPPSFPHFHMAPQYPLQGSSGGENKTIWIGDLHQWMDENYLLNCFASTNEVNSVKVIRNKQTGSSEGYGFVEFFTHGTAEKVLQNFSGMLMPNTEQPFRLNWATFSTGDKRSDNTPDLSIFVGDLASDVNDSLLHETFASRYPSVKAAKVVIDANTGRSKGYGFVRFSDDAEKTSAMTEMNGAYCSTRPMRIGAATPRKSSSHSQDPAANATNADNDPNNTTIFVGGLDQSVTDDELRQTFLQHGEIVSVKIPVGKGCGFVQYANRADAEVALKELNGVTLGKASVRLSWGRNPITKQQHKVEYATAYGGAYYGGHMYEGYGYGHGLPYGHDPSMYAGYGAYPVFGNHQQQVS